MDTTQVLEITDAAKNSVIILNEASRMNPMQIANIKKMLNADGFDLFILDEFPVADYKKIAPPVSRPFDKLMRDLQDKTSNHIQSWNAESQHDALKRLVRDKKNDVWYAKFNKRKKN